MIRPAGKYRLGGVKANCARTSIHSCHRHCVREPVKYPCIPQIPTEYYSSQTYIRAMLSTRIQRNIIRTLLAYLKKPQIADVMVTYGTSLPPRDPRNLVCPTSLPSPLRDIGLVRIIDFGEASLQGQGSRIHIPLVFQAPEIIFTSQQDFRTDVWSLACTVRAS